MTVKMCSECFNAYDDGGSGETVCYKCKLGKIKTDAISRLTKKKDAPDDEKKR